ncbi:MAG TPA: diaminopimelate decarboxylase, partial [Herpetosiphonaceae bacterium]|nr:diaminopimelate decarboxylase [Herpetosiphonaceae bacterium]
AEYGTPLYLLDEATVRTTASRLTSGLRRHYPAPSAVHYAGKALLNTAVAGLMAACGLGLDCVSLGELAIARRAGLDMASTHLHGNAKPLHELRQALDWGVGRIIVDNLDELRLLGALARDRAEPQRVLLRLNPGVDVHTHAHIQTGQLDSKFGLPIATGMAEEAVQSALQLPGIRLTGLHMHLGSQITVLEPIRRAITTMFDFAGRMRARYGWAMEEFSPGGGLGVAYAPGDPAPQLESYVRLLADTVVTGARTAGLAPPRLVIEPGRSLIARAVVAVYQVVATKNIAGVRHFVAVDGGMGDNIRPALYDARYHAVRADRVDAEPGGTVTVVGRYCESGDVLLRDIVLPPVEPGTLLAIPMAGAYTLSMASNYNLVPRPPLVLLRDGERHIIQRRETLEDLLVRDLPWPIEGSAHVS